MTETPAKNRGGRPSGTATGVLSRPDQLHMLRLLWVRAGMSDKAIARVLSDYYKTSISTGAVVGRRSRAGITAADRQ